MSKTCFEKPGVDPQEGLYMQFYGIFSCIRISSLVNVRMCLILLEDIVIEEKTIFKWVLTEIHSEMGLSGSGEEPVALSCQYGHSRQLILRYHKRRYISWEAESPSRWKENMQMDLYRNNLWNGFILILEERRGTSDEFLWKRQLILQNQKGRDISWEAESRRSVLHWVLY